MMSIVVIFTIALLLLFISFDLPSIDRLQDYKPVQIAKIISADGKPIKELYIEQRDIINIGKVPKNLRRALVFMEDRKFFEHPGIDVWGIVRAVSVNLSGGGALQGASTLTQQLARNMYDDIGFEKSILRKVKEFITAIKIEQIYTKSEIMELYLNSVFFGHQAYGVQQASKFYFSKDVKDLTLNQSATLVGLLPAPNRYSPKRNIDTVIGYARNFNSINQNKTIENPKREVLTKISGKLKENQKLILTDLVFLNHKLDTIPIIVSNDDKLTHSISKLSYKYEKKENDLVVYITSNEKIKYYSFRVIGLKNMSINGVGEGVASSLGFVEINNSSKSIKRKNLVLSIMHNQNYIDKEEFYYNSLMPIEVSTSASKNYGVGFYFAEDVRSKLSEFQQSMSYDNLSYILPDFPNKNQALKSWLNKNYKMILNINGKQFDLYKDGLRVFTTLDTRVQKFVSDIYDEKMQKNQFDLHSLYSGNIRKLDTVLYISKNRKMKELEYYYKTNYYNVFKKEIIDKEVQKLQKLGKSKDEIDFMINQGNYKGEIFIDANKNGKYDLGEKFTDGNNQYNYNEKFTDKNKNGKYDLGEIFIDNKNGKYDAQGYIRDRLDLKILKSITKVADSLNYSREYILDILKNKKQIPDYLRKEFLVQGSVVVLDVKTGNIIAMIGGRQEKGYIDYFNRASKAIRQPGSIFKPFIYMTALKNYDNEHQPFSTSYKIYNQPLNIPIDDYTSFNPQNHDRSTGGLTTLRNGLKKSLNLISVRLISKIEDGPKKVKKQAEKFGISTPIYPGEALALGASDVIPLEITAAYSAISNNGVLLKPNYINKIENSLGETLESNKFNENFSEKNEALVYIIRDMMKDVINSGTGRSLKTRYGFNSPVAGKTGTTNNFTDAWFVGFTPQIAIGVWVGMDNPAVSINKYGSQAALPIFAESIKKIYDFGEYSLGYEKVTKLDKQLDWTKPNNGLVEKKLCKESMKIANKYCNQRSGLVDEIFLEGFMPEKCDISSHLSRYK
ncbi:MAG: hypothetical protein CMG00_02035 [Candidatus Marinimicrobia bacterium]|nr:hypothetical protein [Candidatus Neomarinimicrobiota bacterium]